MAMTDSEIKALKNKIDEGSYTLETAEKAIAEAAKGADVREAIYAVAYMLNKGDGVGSEVVDARTDYTGVEFTTLGEAVRHLGLTMNDAIEAIRSDASSEENNIWSFIRNQYYHPTLNAGYISSKDMSYNESTTYKYSSVFRVPPMTKVTLSVYSSKEAATMVVCDSDGTPQRIVSVGVGTSDKTTVEYVDSATSYIRICFRANDNGSGQNYTDETSGYMKLTEYTDAYRSIDAEWDTGYIGTDGSVVDSDYFRYSSMIMLNRGETLEFYGGCSENSIALSEWTPAGVFSGTLVAGTDEYGHYTYKASHNMYVRISGKVKKDDTKEEDLVPWVSINDLKAPIAFYRSLYDAPLMRSSLYGKSLTFLGDSLAWGGEYGGNLASWSNLLGIKYNMTINNQGVCGSSLAYIATETKPSMAERCSSLDDTDFYVVLGGANDFRLNVPIDDPESPDGTHDDYDCFSEAVQYIFNTIRHDHPNSHIVFLTNYHRKDGVNEIGKYEIDYVNSMLEVCRKNAIPCFDNYHCSGMDFWNWMDEGTHMGLGGNLHISPKGYEWLLPVYENFLNA